MQLDTANGGGQKEAPMLTKQEIRNINFLVKQAELELEQELTQVQGVEVAEKNIFSPREEELVAVIKRDFDKCVFSTEIFPDPPVRVCMGMQPSC